MKSWGRTPPWFVTFAIAKAPPNDRNRTNAKRLGEPKKNVRVSPLCRSLGRSDPWGRPHPLPDRWGHAAGPLLDESGNPCGSLILFEADDLASARLYAAEDPYVIKGVFASHEVNETKVVFPK